MRQRVNAAALLLFLFCAASVRAEWRIVSSQPQGTAAGGVVHVVTQAEESESGTRATLHLAIFSPKTATLRVIDDPEVDDSLGAIMPREKCVAGVNGGYFDPDYAPVGLLVSGGRTVAPLRKAKLLSGVVSAASGRVQIQRTGEFSSKAKPIEARQCGPFLLERSRPITGLNETRPARRTFVASSGSDRAAIGYCSYVTLAQLAALLATQGVAGDFKPQRALNLDGGSSSGFWFADESGPFSIREQKRVRDYVGIAAK